MSQYEIDSCGFGLLVNTNNHKSSLLVQTALTGLSRLSHRGAVGEDGLTGDGCGLMIQLDHLFFATLAQEQAINLPSIFAVGMCFLNKNDEEENKRQLEKSLKTLGFHIAGWRQIPVDLNYAGKNKEQDIPVFAQIFIHFPEQWPTPLVEEKLYIAKLLTLHALKEDTYFSICSLSTQTIVYKALVLPENLPHFYPDLRNPDLQSAVALFHQRFSTNTLCSWRLAQPFSTLAHNGEINTIQGNRHYAQQLSQSLIKNHFPELHDLDTLIDSSGSDSLSLDNFLEGLIHAGLSCPEALRLIIPPAWENNNEMSDKEKNYYNYHAPHLPPWEGPAGIVFFDGRFAGCILDRNGFRPARMVKSRENWIGIGSEIGLFDFKDQEITELSRIHSGELLVIDLIEQKVIAPQNYIKTLFKANPYTQWENKYKKTFSDQNFEDILTEPNTISNEAFKRFDVSFEEKEQVLRYMAENAIEPTHSMGDDTPIAALSFQARQLFDFFRQQFAQVTNPPIDSLREKSVLSLRTYLGNRHLITQRHAEFARIMELPSPLLTSFQQNHLNNLNDEHFKSIKISLAYPSTIPLKEAIDNLKKEIGRYLNNKYHLLIHLNDEHYAENDCLIHPALAVGALHHELINQQQRGQVSLIVHSGWVREAHHVAMLIACGADATYPWLAYKLTIDLAKQNKMEPLQVLLNLRHALNKGLLKICAKMGVCTVNSYKGAQLFHLIGLDREIILSCFSQSSYWLEKYNWHTLDTQQKEFFKFSRDSTREPRQGGLYKFTPQGEYHDYNPDVVTNLLRAVSENNSNYYIEFKELINKRQPVMVRDFLHIKKNTSPVKLEDVEELSAIIKRFDTAAMSLGALSPEAHEALAIAMNTLGGRSNSGEGGEASYRYGTLKRSKIKQIASARFGVTAEYLMQAEVIQIKIAQGAKPGEGGQLPGNKVNQMIAELRYCSPGVSLISPPPHHDIYSIEDLAQLIFDLKQINPNAFISVKLVSAPGIGTIAAGVVKAYADMITISGYDGGTGASPLSSIRHTGCPWELGLSETQNVLLKNNLRHRVTLQVDGGLKTGLDVIKAALLGAESFGFGTAPMITLGCKYLRICHLNNCATGIATQDERLRTQFYQGLSERVILYFQWVAQEVRELLAQMGVLHLRDIIGRVDLLETLEQYQPHNMSVDDLLIQSSLLSNYQEKLYLQPYNPPFDKALLAKKILNDVLSAIKQEHPFQATYDIANKDRSIGANIAGEIAKHYGNRGFQSLIELSFKGMAGQSFGAWLVQGMSLQLEGAANDYVAKGMNGGLLVIKPTPKIPYTSIATIAGNTCLYGATGGVCFIDGLAGERFAVRNSGAIAVVLGIGDHGCEYMTAGTILILGTPGNNFAAGMTGGIAFVYDDKNLLEVRTNQESVTLHNLAKPDLTTYQQQFLDLLHDFYRKTQSLRAADLLKNIERHWSQFYLILPNNSSTHCISPKMEKPS